MSWPSRRRTRDQAVATHRSRCRGGPGPGVEALEERRLLSFFQPYTAKVARVKDEGAVFLVAVSGPGQVHARRSPGGNVAIDLFGTTQDSQVTVSALGTHPGAVDSHLSVGSIKVRSERVGAIQGLTTLDLLGRVSPLKGPVSALQFDAVGPSAQVDVAGNLGLLAVNRDMTLGPMGHLNIAQDLTGAFTVGGNLTLSGGRVDVGRDLAGPVTVGGDLAASGGGQFRVGRDAGTAAGGVKVAGNALLGSGGALSVGRELLTLSVGGRLDTSAGGRVEVGGDLKTLMVNGVIRGSGAIDLAVGLDLGQLTVLGGQPGAGGVEGAAIAVGKDLQGLDVRYGVFNSRITAGILIDGGTPGAGSNGWNLGPDGPIAVFDSQILAGSILRNLTIGGDVVSDHPTNPAGIPTRIEAGVDAQGSVTAGGVIDNFQIVGQLVNAVVAASVQPYGGTGAVAPAPTTTSNDNGYKTFDKPAGTVQVGVVGNSMTTPVYTAPPYDASGDPTIDDLVLPGGAINPSFATQPLATTPPPATGTQYPLPTKSTVLGGVVSTSHGDTSDFAGLFAANTSGVFVGMLPP